MKAAPSEALHRECRQPAGAFQPHIDRNRCEGKGDCLAVCPYEVFTMGVLPADARAGLSLRGKIKGWAHGWQQAFTPNADACRACGLCVKACPENAITLVRTPPMHNRPHHGPSSAD